MDQARVRAKSLWKLVAQPLREQASGLNSFLGEWFEAYEEYSIGDFVTQNVVQEEYEYENGTAYRIKCMTWLAPFDLGVSQRVLVESLFELGFRPQPFPTSASAVSFGVGPAPRF